MVKIGLIGVGNMGIALYENMKNDAKFILNNRNMSKIENLKDEWTEIVDFDNIGYLIEESDYIMIGVKPKDFPKVFDDIKDLLDPENPKKWISMAAGISFDELYSFVPNRHSWLRIMPNTPVKVGNGFVGYSFNKEKEEYANFLEILKNTGNIESFSENDLEIVSVFSGCSPAYFFVLVEAMTDSAVSLGLSREKSLKIVSETLKGSAEMLLKTKKHPGELKDEVTSPAGTTIQGILELERRGFRSSIIEACLKSFEKNEEILRGKN